MGPRLVPLHMACSSFFWVYIFDAAWVAIGHWREWEDEPL
jgi:hypothetical protein